MFEPEDFKLNMESSLRLRVISDDIDKCNSINELKSQLKDCVRMTMQYQQMLAKVLEKTIIKDLDNYIEKLEKEGR